MAAQRVPSGETKRSRGRAWALAGIVVLGVTTLVALLANRTETESSTTVPLGASHDEASDRRVAATKCFRGCLDQCMADPRATPDCTDGCRRKCDVPADAHRACVASCDSHCEFAAEKASEKQCALDCRAQCPP